MAKISKKNIDEYREDKNMRKKYAGEDEPVSDSVLAGVGLGSYLGVKKVISKFKSSTDLTKVPSTPDLSPAEVKEAGVIRRKRNAVMNFKVDMNKLGKKTNNPNRSAVIKRNTFNRELRLGGVDVSGKAYGKDFVKSSNIDKTIQRATPSSIKNSRSHGFNAFKKGGKKVRDIRGRMMNRVYMHELAGDRGSGSHFYRKGPKSEVTLVPDNINKKVSKADLINDKFVLDDIAERGVLPKDIGGANVGMVDGSDKIKVIDFGHSEVHDYGKLAKTKKISMLEKIKNVVSKRNLKLTGRAAKQFGKRLPVIAPLIGAASYLMGDKAAAGEIFDPTGSERIADQDHEDQIIQQHRNKIMRGN